jgi:hypothetical protein
VDDETFKALGLGSPISPNTIATDTISPRTPTPPKKNRLFGNKAESEEPPTHSVWVAREGMQMAVRSRKGDYRRVAKETWLAIKECYPGTLLCVCLHCPCYIY